jgi:hypothetical protein
MHTNNTLFLDTLFLLRDPGAHMLVAFDRHAQAPIAKGEYSH